MGQNYDNKIKFLYNADNAARENLVTDILHSSHMY